MDLSGQTFSVLVIGLIISLSIILKSFGRKVNIPSVLIYLLIGFALKLLDVQHSFLTEQVHSSFELLGKIGVVVLLFDVGLKSQLESLLSHLRAATPIWLSNVFFCSLIGFAVGFWILQIDIIPSLFLATAFTATSVGITTALWKEKGVLEKPLGQLLIDVAELDDLSGVLLMGLLLSVVPAFLEGSMTSYSEITKLAAQTAGWFGLKFFLFIILCFAFAKLFKSYISPHLKNYVTPIERTLIALGICFIISSLGAGIGLSLAIGAFFAGIVFSRDEETVRNDCYFAEIRELMAPFFFIGISLQIEPNMLLDGLYIGGIILFFAFLSKILAIGLAASFKMKALSALLLGMSMVPRAEITLIIFQQGSLLGEAAVPGSLYTGMVVAVMGTTLISPPIINKLIDKTFNLT